MRLFRGKSLQEIQEITFEIGMLGKYGLDINDPQESHVLRALPGRVFSALQLICIMYAGFKRIKQEAFLPVPPPVPSSGPPSTAAATPAPATVFSCRWPSQPAEIGALPSRTRAAGAFTSTSPGSRDM